MEKDSFENQLRNKVWQAEAAIHQNSDKDRVWNSIQKKKQPRRKWYYAAAVAIVFIISLASVFYIKNDEVIVVTTKTTPLKHGITALPKQLVIELAKVKQVVAPIRRAGIEQITAVKPSESATPITNAIAPEEGLSIAVSPITNEAVSVIPKNVGVENKINSIAIVVPEFTVQLKRGAPIANHFDENIIIAVLKKFKLKRDTTYFANAAEKQPTKIKLSFKKEN